MTVLMLMLVVVVAMLGWNLYQLFIGNPVTMASVKRRAPARVPKNAQGRTPRR